MKGDLDRVWIPADSNYGRSSLVVAELPTVPDDFTSHPRSLRAPQDARFLMAVLADLAVRGHALATTWFNIR